MWKDLYHDPKIMWNSNDSSVNEFRSKRYNLTTYEMFCSNKFVVSVKNLFDVAIKSQGHSDLIVICETPPCPNTYTKKI